MSNKWYKHSFVCPMCDSAIECITISSIIDPARCTNCAEELVLLSVEDVTIEPSTTKKEETNMDTLTPAQTMTLDWSENDTITTKTYTESDVRALVYRDKSYATKMNEYYRKESQLRTLLEEVYADSDEQDTLSQIAQIFDVPLTKEIEVTAYIQVQMTVEVDMADGDYDIESFVRDNLTIDSYDSAVSVNNYDVERVEEN